MTPEERHQKCMEIAIATGLTYEAVCELLMVEALEAREAAGE